MGFKACRSSTIMNQPQFRSPKDVQCEQCMFCACVCACVFLLVGFCLLSYSSLFFLGGVLKGTLRIAEIQLEDSKASLNELVSEDFGWLSLAPFVPLQNLGKFRNVVPFGFPLNQPTRAPQKKEAQRIQPKASNPRAVFQQRASPESTLSTAPIGWSTQRTGFCSRHSMNMPINRGRHVETEAMFLPISSVNPERWRSKKGL